jgi:hypothetical protein
MNAIAIEQLTSLALLIIFLFGIACGVVGGAVLGSRRGTLLVPAADGLLGAGARVIYGTYIRDDGGYPRSLPQGNGQALDDPSGDDSPGSQGQELNR